MIIHTSMKKDLPLLRVNSLFHIASLWIVLNIIIFYTTYSQTNPNFNVNLLMDYSAVEKSIDLFEDEYVNTQTLSELRGNRIAASTTGLIANRGNVINILKNFLDSLRYHQIIRDDIYHLEDARKNVANIKELLEEMKKQNFNRRVAATVEQIFPEDANFSVTIPVYVVALGHENVDAYVRRIIWHGDTPQFVGENAGELNIVINLTHSIDYGTNVEERFISLLGVVAHEVFHAAFSAYKENSRSWKYFYKNRTEFIDDLLDLTQNEGIAYYLSFDQRGRGFVPRDWNVKIRQVFSEFNDNATQLLSDSITHERAGQLIRKANLSGSWENYGAMTGMFIAREIDLRLGRAALIETISLGPLDYFQKYSILSERDSELPKFSTKIEEKIRKKQIK